MMHDDDKRSVDDMSNWPKNGRTRFSISLNPEEQVEVRRVADRLEFSLDAVGVKKDTIMAAIRGENKRLDELEIRAQSYTPHELEFMLRSRRRKK